MSLPLLASNPGFSPASRVWVYVANRRLNDAEAGFVQDQLNAFVVQWTAHNQALQAAAEVYDHQALILMVDETQAGASGCSIDKSVHFLEALGREVDADFFERMRFGWADEAGALHWAGRAEMASLVQDGRVRADTQVLNTLVQTQAELAEKWFLPFEKSWHKRLF